MSSKVMPCVWCQAIQLIQGRCRFRPKCHLNTTWKHRMWDILRFLQFTYPYPYIILAGNLNKSLVCNDIIGGKAQDAKSKKGLPTNIRITYPSYRYWFYWKILSMEYFRRIYQRKISLNLSYTNWHCPC